MSGGNQQNNPFAQQGNPFVAAVEAMQTLAQGSMAQMPFQLPQFPGMPASMPAFPGMPSMPPMTGMAPMPAW